MASVFIKYSGQGKIRVSAEAELLLAIARGVIADDKKPIGGMADKFNINWNIFRTISAYHELSPFVYPAIKEWQSLVPGEIADYYKRESYFNYARSCYLLEEFFRIKEEFERLEVKLVPIKGIALLADIYADRPIRPMCDIDLLVNVSDLQKAKDILLNMGYTLQLQGLREEYWINHQCHLPFSRIAQEEQYYVDMHFGLDFKRKGKNILPGLWERISKVSVENRMIALLSPEDSLFSLALHLRRFGKILNLKNVLDTALILKKYNRGLDWGYIFNESKLARMRSAVYFAILQTNIFLGTLIPDYAWKGLGVSLHKKQLMRKLILGHTFSKRLDPRRVYLAALFLYRLLPDEIPGLVEILDFLLLFVNKNHFIVYRLPKNPFVVGKQVFTSQVLFYHPQPPFS